jgi:hypothetical protein
LGFWMLRTALTDTSVQDFGKDLVSAGHLDGVVVDEFHGSTEAAHKGGSLGFGDLGSRHF